MTTSIKKTSNRKLPFVPNIDNVCTTLINEHNMLPKEKTMITGIQNFGARTGFVTSKQLSALGRCSKTYIQKGNFVEHDWWNNNG